MAQEQHDREAGNKLKTILCHHKLPVSHLSDEEIAQKRGIFIHNKYYWLDCNLKLNVEVLARALDITWSSSPQYWTYKKEQFKCETIDVAELLNVCWLNVEGKQDTRLLTQCTEYEVLFDIKLNRCASGWYEPVNFSLTTPDGNETKRQVKLDQYIGQGYVEVPVGKFSNSGSCGCKHDLEFKLYEHGGHWKSGLVVRGVIVRAVKLIT